MPRTFKTADFSKAAKKARISDAELCATIAEVERGLVVDLGGGVFKKRLRRNEYRSLLISRSGAWWVFEFLFAKNHRENISSAELHDLRKLANAYARLTPTQLGEMLSDQLFIEICHET